VRANCSFECKVKKVGWLRRYCAGKTLAKQALGALPVLEGLGRLGACAEPRPTKLEESWEQSWEASSVPGKLVQFSQMQSVDEAYKDRVIGML
jgi:hypothetical protein